MSPKPQPEPKLKVPAISLVIEGGGDDGKSRSLLASGFKALLKTTIAKATKKRIRFDVVMGGGKNKAHEHFTKTYLKHPQVCCMLLIDADSKPDDLTKPWVHAFKQHNMDRGEATDKDCHLMVMTIESWLLCDPKALAEYYGKNFKPNGLPKPAQVEQVPKATQEAELKRATADTQKESYHKIRHAADLLAKVDPKELLEHSKSFKRFVQTLEDWIAAVP